MPFTIARTRTSLLLATALLVGACGSDVDVAEPRTSGPATSEPSSTTQAVSTTQPVAAPDDDSPEIEADQCGATFIDNDGADPTNEASRCFDSARSEGRAADWDVVLATVEGDPILVRYELEADGSVRILRDNSRDTFGGPTTGVAIEDCDSLSGTGLSPLPEGVGCEPNIEFDLPNLPLPTRE